MGTCCDAFDKHKHVWQTLNPLFIHVIFTAIVPGTYTGRPKYALGWLQKLSHVPLAIAILLVQFICSPAIQSLLSIVSSSAVQYDTGISSITSIIYCELNLHTVQRTNVYITVTNLFPFFSLFTVLWFSHS